MLDDENEANMMASDLDNSRRRYIRSLVHEVYVAQLEVEKRELPTEDMTREYREALQSVYITKTEALELLHVQLASPGATTCTTWPPALSSDRTSVTAWRNIRPKIK